MNRSTQGSFRILCRNTFRFEASVNTTHIKLQLETKRMFEVNKIRF